jgi:hypothetical protein
MNNQGIKYEFSAKVWYYSSLESKSVSTSCGWHFVSLPEEMAKKIRNDLQFLEEGWGRMKVTAKTGNTEWKTSIWFDTKHKTYILPLKAEIRKKESIDTDKDVEVTIWI